MKDNLKKLVFTLVVVFGFGLINVNALVYVNGEQLSTEKKSITAGNGTVSYNDTTKELTLKNATINSTLDTGFDGVINFTKCDGVTIKLVGANTITNTGSISGIHSTCNLTITGEGTLEVDTKGYSISLSSGNLIFDGAKVNLNATDSSTPAIYANNDITIQNNSNLIASGTSYGLRATSLTIDNSLVKALGDTGSVFLYDYDKVDIGTLTFSNLTKKSINYYASSDNKYKLDLTSETIEEDLAYISYGIYYFEVVSDIVYVDVPVVNKDTKVEEVTVGVENSTTLNDTLTADIKTKYPDLLPENTSVLVESSNIAKEDIPEAEVNAINELITKNGLNAVASYFDLTLKVVSLGSEVGTISETSNKIKFQVALPDELKEVKDGYTRTYYIIRYHDNLAEVLDTKLGDNLLTFESDKFSTYAITYVDTKIPVTTKDETNPKTGDNVVLYTVISIISLLGIAGAIKLSKKTN